MDSLVDRKQKVITGQIYSIHIPHYFWPLRPTLQKQPATKRPDTNSTLSWDGGCKPRQHQPWRSRS